MYAEGGDAIATFVRGYVKNDPRKSVLIFDYKIASLNTLYAVRLQYRMFGHEHHLLG